MQIFELVHLSTILRRHSCLRGHEAKDHSNLPERKRKRRGGRKQIQNIFLCWLQGKNKNVFAMLAEHRTGKGGQKDKGLHLCTALLRLVCVQGLVQYIEKCILMRPRNSGG